MEILGFKSKGGIGLAMCLMLFLLVSLAVADDKKDKDKEKDHSSKGSSQSHKVSNSEGRGRGQSNGGGNGGAQSGGQSSGSSHDNNGTSNSRFSRDSNPRNNRVSEQTTSQDKHSDGGNANNGTSNSRFSRDSNPRNNNRVSEQTTSQDKHSDSGNDKNNGYGNRGNNGKDADSGNNARFDRGNRYDRNNKSNVSDNRDRREDFSRRDRVTEHDRTVVRDVHTRTTEVRTFRAPVRTERNFGDRRVAFDNRGRVRDIHSRDMVIHRSLRGERTFVTERSGVRIVSVGGHYGYTQRTYISRGPRVYVQRTYVVGGVTYARAYRTYNWHGAVFYSYAPAYYYRPAFYVWTFNPWPRPIYYRWGWASDPWYPAYGYYFQPYAYYPTASAWLVDYLIAENLRLSYEARRNAELAAQQQQYDQAPPQDYPQNGPAQDGNTVQLSPEVKQMIAEEVQRQLAAERAAAEQGANGPQAAPAPVQDGDPGAQGGEEVPAALDPNHRVFVVSSNLDVATDDGQECTLTPGDVILRTSNNPDGTKVAVNVVSSKQGDCASNTNAAVEVNDLQEMHNHFREQLDSGMKSLAQNQGKNGLPAAPDTGTVNGEVPPPTADSNVQNELQDQQNAADGVEGAVKAAEKSPGL